jgi:pimeloyl-ACP methyl ester carboxylesterase
LTNAPAEDCLELAGGRVHLFRGGEGKPLLFLHAAGGAGTWLEFHQLLARRGFDVIAPDHPGFGKSDEFPEVEAIDDLVYHYLDVMDALGLDHPHVVGASIGGWIAAELAVAAPHRVGSLVLLSAAGLRLPEHPVTDFFLLPRRSSPGCCSTTRLRHRPSPSAHRIGTRPDHQGVDQRGAVRLVRRQLRVPLRQHLAKTTAEAAPAGLHPRRGQHRDDEVLRGT